MFSNSYKAYINSEAWRQKRGEFFASRCFKDCCWCCSEKSDSYDVHHQTYKNFGNEKLSDLAAVCRACHDEIHARHYNMPRHDLYACTQFVRQRRRKSAKRVADGMRPIRRVRKKGGNKGKPPQSEKAKRNWYRSKGTAKKHAKAKAAKRNLAEMAAQDQIRRERQGMKERVAQ